MFGEAKEKHELLPDTIDIHYDKFALKSRLHDDGKILPFSKPRNETHIISADNEEEWGHIADELGQAMIVLFVEYQIYEIILEEKSKITSNKTFVGRIANYINQNNNNTTNTNGTNTSTNNTNINANNINIKNNVDNSSNNQN
jgi:hypothetical protein